MTNDHINVRNVYIELLNKLKNVEGVDIQYIDHLVDLLNQDIYLVETDVKWIESLIPSGASSEDQLVKHSDLPSFTQVNSDWNATSGVAEILNKPSIPAAQVNSDWNANSGVAQILNKPTIPVITSEMVSQVLDVDDWLTYPQDPTLYICPFNIYDETLDDSKPWIINLIPSSSGAIAPTAAESAAYNKLLGVNVENLVGNIRVELFCKEYLETEYKILFSYWKLL